MSNWKGLKKALDNSRLTERKYLNEFGGVVVVPKSSHSDYYPAGMTLCYSMHLLGNGCTDDYFDEDCKECPFNNIQESE